MISIDRVVRALRCPGNRFIDIDFYRKVLRVTEVAFPHRVGTVWEFTLPRDEDMGPEWIEAQLDITKGRGLYD